MAVAKSPIFVGPFFMISSKYSGTSVVPRSVLDGSVGEAAIVVLNIEVYFDKRFV